MPLPKGFRKNVKIVRPKEGVARRGELVDNFTKKGTFLPRGVSYEDIDKSFIEFVNKEAVLVVDGDKVPIIFLTLQRWSEFSKTWQHSDKYKNLKMPFVTIVRNPDVQVGLGQDGNWNVSSNYNMYTYIKVPTFEGGRKGVDIYKVPQPTSIDVKYNVRLFTNKMRNINDFNVKMLKIFNSRQHYLSIKGHPMPVLLEGISDESNIDDFENRRFYVQNFNMRLLGYTLDEDDFEVVPTVSRFKLTEKIIERTYKFKPKVSVDKVSKVINLNFTIKESKGSFNFKSDFDMRVNELFKDNLSTITFEVGGQVKSIPFVVNGGDDINVTFIKENNNNDSYFELSGKLL